MKKITTFILVIMFVGIFSGENGQAKIKDINDYLSASFDVEKVEIVKSKLEFLETITENQMSPAVEETISGRSNGITNTIEAKVNGCLLIFPYSDNANLRYDTQIIISDVTTKKITTLYNEKFTRSDTLLMIPIEKGHCYNIEKDYWNNYAGVMKYYYSFIPYTSTFNIDNVIRKENGSIEVQIGNVYENGTSLSVVAANKEYSFNEIYLGQVTFKYSSTDNSGDAILVLPENGVYTLKIQTTLEKNIISFQVLIFDTKSYLEPTLDKVDTPYSVLDGTNVIVGKCEPSAEVFATYNGKKYKAKANRAGIYKIRLDEDMIEGKPIKIWQKKNGIVSKKTSIRVTAE